jgi:2-oxoglutarate ferredoxin oxidoreductase subunit alpha
MHLNPFPANIGDVLGRYGKVLVPELNLGQLSMLLRAKFLIDVRAYSKVQGQPIFAEELENEILRVMSE